MTDIPTIPTARHRLSRRLVVARQSAGLSQEDLAARLGVTRQAVAAWEAADGDITLTTATRWAATLGFDLTLASAVASPVLVDDLGRPVPWRTLTMHATVTGPGRDRVLAALALDCGGLPVRSLDAAVGDPIVGDELETFLADLGSFRARPAVVVAELGDRSDERAGMLRDLLARARSNGVIVLLGADGEVPGDLAQNTALRLHAAADGSVTDETGGRWRLAGDAVR